MFANRIKEIEPFLVMTLLEKALQMEREGKNIVHFEIGEPDFDTPAPIIEGCFAEIEKGRTHYTHSLGYLDLRKTIADYKMTTRKTRYRPETEIMVTAGSSPAFLMVLGALLNPGDEVIITDPGYPCYINYIRFFQAIPKFLKIYEEDRFDLQIENLEALITHRTKLIILNSPSNPTGQIIPSNTLAKIADLIAEHKIWVISDEIYAELTYDLGLAPSLSEKKYERCHDRLIVIDGFSKFWAMTGWRLGYILAPEKLMNELIKLQQNFMICAPSVSQSAALYAFQCLEETDQMLQTYKTRRDLIVSRLNEIEGISCLPPAGAFYAFANIKALKRSSLKFSFDLLENAHIAATPGIAFGENGEGYIRFSYPTGLENIEEGTSRLKKYVEKMS